MKIDEFENSVDANEAAHDDKPPHLGLHYLQIQHFLFFVFGTFNVNCQNIGIFVVFFSIKVALKSLISQYGYSFLHFFLKFC